MRQAAPAAVPPPPAAADANGPPPLVGEDVNAPVADAAPPVVPEAGILTTVLSVIIGFFTSLVPDLNQAVN